MRYVARRRRDTRLAANDRQRPAGEHRSLVIPLTAIGGRAAIAQLPNGIEACVFDMDGVLTETATVHAAAWKQTFDDYLRGRADGAGEPFRPFDADLTGDPHPA